MAKIITARYAMRVQFYVFMGAVASVPFSVEANRYLIIALSIASFVVIDWNSLKENFKEKKRILLAGSVALLNLVGLIYTSDIHDGFALLERSAITLVIPVIILLITPSRLEINRILYFFIFVCLLVCFYCLLFSFWKIYQTGSVINTAKMPDRTYYFFINNELTATAMNLSPIYLGLYINLCIAFLLVRIFIEKKKKQSDIILLALFHFFQIIIFSLSAVIALFALWMLALLKIVSDKTLPQQITILLLFLTTIGIAFFGVYKIKPLHDRIFINVDYNFENAHASYWNGITLRLAIWECAWDAVKETPLIGNGTGDVDEVLLHQYKQKKFSLAEMLVFSTHNQYLESYLMHGVLGFATILLVLLIPIYHAWKETNWLLAMLVVILFLGFFTEVILIVQKGIVFFSIFFPLLYLPATEKK